MASLFTTLWNRPCVRAFRSRSQRHCKRESRKRVGVWAGSRLSMSKGERFGLSTRIATESVSLCVPMKSWRGLWNSKQ